MFLEISKKKFEELKKQWDKNNIKYEVSDCTLPGENEMIVHIEFEKSLTQEQIYTIEAQMEAIYGQNAVSNWQTKDTNANGLPDILEEENELVEKRVRKWDKESHTLKEQAMGWFTGADQEEEVTYERR